MYLAHQELGSVNIIMNIVIIIITITTTFDAIGETYYDSQPFCAESCEVASLILWQDAQVQNDGFSYQVSFDCTKQQAVQEHFNSIHTPAGKERSVVTHP